MRPGCGSRRSSSLLSDHLLQDRWNDAAVAQQLQLQAAGVDLLEVSSGNIVPGYAGDVYPGYHLKYAEALKRETGLPVGAMGSITSPDHAESILASGGADLVFLGRELLRNPFWVIGRYSCRVVRALPQ